MRFLFILSSLFFLTSCEKFLEVELPTTLVPQQLVFKDDITATSAIKGIYSNLIQIDNFSSGSNICAATLTGLSADELQVYNRTILGNSEYIQFDLNNLIADNVSVLSLWTTAYKTIYDANSAIEGLEGSTGLTSSVKDQLLGEALFIRAYAHFYLVNLFGDIPLITTTDYQINSTIARTPVSEVYELIKSDLHEARILLSDTYAGTGRARVNKSVANAFLARVSLYMGDWETAESMATIVIENDLNYELEEDLNEVFTLNNREAIWQLPLSQKLLNNYTTYEGNFFYINSDQDLSYYILNDDLVSSFDSVDLRRINWIGKYTAPLGLVYFAAKYKVKYGSDPAKEASTVLRLAEQYLIRAEARARLDKISLAVGDIDAIRDRSNLELIQEINPSITKADLLLEIENERRKELFTEGCHRWFDLNRTNRADQVLGALKPTWNQTDKLYPVPQNELIKNKKLAYQNQGY